MGAAGDNAAMESFFALLQKNVLDRQRWATREQLRIAIEETIGQRAGGEQGGEVGHGGQGLIRLNVTES